jgi:hypothetical protein
VAPDVQTSILIKRIMVDRPRKRRTLKNERRFVRKTGNERHRSRFAARPRLWKMEEPVGDGRRSRDSVSPVKLAVPVSPDFSGDTARPPSMFQRNFRAETIELNKPAPNLHLLRARERRVNN